MNPPTITEFAQYRFVRDVRGNVITLPSQGVDERILLVLDCEKWGLARLHIFEGAASRNDKLEAFQEELQQIAEIHSDRLSNLISWGRDAEELFYADEMKDGEPLPAYLGRAGGVPLAVACEWICQFLELFESFGRLPSSLERFSTLNFEVVLDRFGKIFPVFSEFHGWTKPGARVSEHRTEWYFAQRFCSLIAGVPIRTFHRDSLPRNFDELNSPMRGVILDTLDESGTSTLELFRSVMMAGAMEAREWESAITLPVMPVREWLLRDLAAESSDSSDYVLEPEIGRGEESYGIQSRLRGAPACIQLVPGPQSIPREGWLNQHHEATRRPGRGTVHQLQVNYLEDRGSITLIGEERVEGVDLESLVGRLGPLPVEVVKEAATSIRSALEGIERPAGSGGVWWLPPENIFVLTGTRSLSGSAGLIERKGPVAWSGFPLKLRLHQTMETLKAGVNLPGKVRMLSRLPGKQNEAARRSAVALPLVWFLLTGSKFRWDLPVKKHDLVPVPVACLVEQFRVCLVEDPDELESDFFHALVHLTLDPHEVADTSAEPPRPTADESLEQALKSALYEGELEIGGPTRDLLVDLDAVVSGGDVPATADAPGGIEESPRRRRIPWVAAAVLGAVVASAVGYGLSGWNLKLGPLQGGDLPEFSLPGFVLEGENAGELARNSLESLLISDGSSEALGLLPLLQRFEQETNREKIDDWLKSRAVSGNAGALRLLGLLSLSEGGNTGAALAYFLRGAKLGDAECQLRFAAIQWRGEELSDEALGLLEVAAKGGHPAAQELLAQVKLASGDAVDAFRWMEFAARQGRVSAIHQLGILYANGSGVEASPEEAAARFKTAAELGDERAMYDFGRCLGAGFGVEASFTEAQRWMRLASARGHGGALRWCLDRGINHSDDPAAEDSETAPTSPPE